MSWMDEHTALMLTVHCSLCPWKSGEHGDPLPAFDEAREHFEAMHAEYLEGETS